MSLPSTANITVTTAQSGLSSFQFLQHRLVPSAAIESPLTDPISLIVGAQLPTSATAQSFIKTASNRQHLAWCSSVEWHHLEVILIHFQRALSIVSIRLTSK